MLAILGWIVFGLIVGVLAKLVMPGKDPGGFVMTTLAPVRGMTRRVPSASRRVT